MSRVLVIDDCPDTVRSLSLLLQHWGHDAQHALDGDSALREAASFHPEAVVLDLGLPRVSGHEVARQLLEASRPGRPLLVALTGFADEHHRQRAREVGFDFYLVKPAAPDVLREALEAARGDHLPAND